MDMIQIIAENLQISEETASNFLENFDVKPEKIRYCGRVNVDVLEEMIRGTQYWIADCDGYVYWGNKEPQCSQWAEETANAIGLPWEEDYETEMEDYHMHTECAFCKKNHHVDNVIKFNKTSNAFYVCEGCYSTYTDRNSK